LRIVGHRGVRAVPSRTEVPPENTIAAFAQALREGADAIELDVRLSKKGIAIIHHDPVPPEIDDTTLPTLAEALDFLSKRAVVNVELKYDFVDRRALAWEAAKVIRSSSAEVIASSFDPRVLFWFAGRLPNVRRAWLANVTQRRIDEAIRAFARPRVFWAMHLERRLANPTRIRMLRDRGVRVGVWTVNDPREARDLFAIGADWLITDWPAGVGGATRGSMGGDSPPRV
jgi:glycerophosphoryl diester phosphodiesterase